MSEKYLVKVIKKDKKGATIQALNSSGYTTLIPWDDFKLAFLETGEEYIYEMIIPQELKTKVDEMQKRLQFFTPEKFALISMAKANYTLENMSILGSISQEYFKEFPDCTPMDFVNDYNATRNFFLNSLGVK